MMESKVAVNEENVSSRRIIFLGTAAAIPTENRGLPSICVKREDDTLIFDVGEGTQMAFVKAKLNWNRKMIIFISHLHGDHILGLPGLIQTMSMRDRNKPLYIYGPKGTAEFISMNLRMLRFTAPFEIVIRDVGEGVVHKTKNYTVTAKQADHSIHALSFLFQEVNRKGKFHPEKALELGVPKGVMWKRLQNGQNVQGKDGIVHPNDVIGKERPGIRIGYSGDTRTTKNLEQFFSNADYLIFDSTFTNEHVENAKRIGHSTSAEAATLARNANVRHLVLTHFSARYENDTISLKEARAIHDSVTAAADQMTINI